MAFARGGGGGVVGVSQGRCGFPNEGGSLFIEDGI